MATAISLPAELKITILGDLQKKMDKLTSDYIRMCDAHKRSLPLAYMSQTWLEQLVNNKNHFASKYCLGTKTWFGISPEYKDVELRHILCTVGDTIVIMTNAPDTMEFLEKLQVLESLRNLPQLCLH